jgi:saccharopine dehydrogenase (NAD+, L-lysine-forming)
MYLEEMKSLPAIFPSLKETGFYVAGFNWFVDYVGIPLVMIGLTISEKLTKPLSKFFEWGLKTFSKKPYGTMLLLESTGLKNKRPTSIRITLSHKDAYLLTAIPVVACLLQYLELGNRKPGLWFQAHFVEPEKFIKDIQRLGIQLSIEEFNIHRQNIT